MLDIFLNRASFKTSPFAQSLRQAQILVLEILQSIPAVKIFAFLDLGTKLNILKLARYSAV
jgi:hypothetical protein